MDFKIIVIFNNIYIQNYVILLTCVIYPKKILLNCGKMIKDPHLWIVIMFLVSWFHIETADYF
jgi:hypothetical protein